MILQGDPGDLEALEYKYFLSSNQSDQATSQLPDFKYSRFTTKSLKISR